MEVHSLPGDKFVILLSPLTASKEERLTRIPTDQFSNCNGVEQQPDTFRVRGSSVTQCCFCQGILASVIAGSDNYEGINSKSCPWEMEPENQWSMKTSTLAVSTVPKNMITGDLWMKSNTQCDDLNFSPVQQSALLILHFIFLQNHENLWGLPKTVGAQTEDIKDPRRNIKEAVAELKLICSTFLQCFMDNHIGFLVVEGSEHFQCRAEECGLEALT